MDPIPSRWHGVDAVLPLLERMRAEGAVIVIKLDGVRGPGDNGPYTIAVSGGRLGNDFDRIDATSIEQALATIIVEYAKRCWGFTEPS